MSFSRIKFLSGRTLLCALAWSAFSFVCLASTALLAQDRMPSTRYEAIAWLESERNTVTKNDDGEVTEIIIDYVPDIFVVGDLDLFPKLELLKINYTGQFYDRHMSGIARLKSLRVFEVDYCDEISEASISVLRYLPNLEEVKLRECEAVYSLKSLAECRSLKKVDLSSNDHLDFEVLKSLRRLPKLESLVLDENSNLEDQHLRWLKGIETLTELRLDDCSGLTDEVFEQLGGIPNLKKLVITDNEHVTGASIGAIKDGSLEELELSGCALDDESLENFKHLKSLRKFDFSGNNEIDGPGLVVLENLRKLEELRLSGLNVTNEQLKSLDGITTLKVVNLSHCSRVSGAGLAALTGSENVEELYLDSCRRVDSEDLNEIVKFKKLEVLDLAGTKVKPEGLELLQQLESLRDLDLSSCNWIDDSAMLKLSKFPALEEVRLDRVLRLTDKALENLAKSATIKRLVLSENRNITGAGVANFEGNQTLVQLQLEQLEKLSAKGLGHLRRLEALEDLNVENPEKFWTGSHLMALHDLPQLKSIYLSGISELDSNLYQDLIDSLPVYGDPYVDDFFDDEE